MVNDFIDKESHHINVGNMFRALMDLPEHTHRIVLKMTKGCFKAVEEIPDKCDKSYALHKCFKTNDVTVRLCTTSHFVHLYINRFKLQFLFCISSIMLSFRDNSSLSEWGKKFPKKMNNKENYWNHRRERVTEKLQFYEFVKIVYCLNRMNNK